MTATDRAGFDPVATSFTGLQFGELAFGASGVLAISTEYNTGMIRMTLTAVPRRGSVLAAQALVLGAFSLIVCETLVFASFFLGQAVLSGRRRGLTLGDPHVARAVISAGVYMSAVTMVGFGLGAILRHTAGAALATLVGLVFLAWPVASAVEGFSYLPDRLLLVNAADVLTATQVSTGAHTARIPPLGLAYLDLALYLVIFLSVAAWRFSRDA